MMFLGRFNTCIYSPTPESKPLTGHSIDTTKIHLGEHMSFFGVIYRNMGEGILMGAEITQTTVSPKLTPV